MVHSNAKPTASGRMLLVEWVVVEGWGVAQPAAAQGVSGGTAYRWWRRFRQDGPEGLVGRSSAPHRRPRALAAGLVEAICSLRRRQGWGPDRIAWELRVARSTVYGVLRRLGLNRLSYLNRITRQTIPYVREHPGDLVHLDIKTLGRIPPGGAKRLDPRWAEAKSGSQSPAGCGMGFEFVHVTVDDASCSAYVEVLPDERGHSAAGFLVRMLDSFAKQGISVKRVLTDNDSCYRSKAFRKTARAWNVKTKRTRPYRPQTNGKAEAFTRVLL